MSNTFGNSDDLKTLQREATELQESRKRTGLAEMKEPEKSPQAAAVKDPGKVGVDAEGAVPREDENQNIAGQLETYLNELEEAAQERPVLALLASFTLGVIVGQIISRR